MKRIIIIVAQHELEIGSMIQFGNPVKYGVIKKIETTGGRASERLAEVELVSHIPLLYSM